MIYLLAFLIYYIFYLFYYIIKQYKEIKKKNKIIDNLELYKQIFDNKYVDDDLDD
tara:strand:- start:730 stop:894 length:165 start_codon:yes stop_codon:yes gene_type:complete